MKMENIYNMMSFVWDDGISGISEVSLSSEMIEDSVGRACDFFHIEHPAVIEPIPVALGDISPYGDEILFFNRAQLEDMGITGQDGLDLVMTHEGTHIALQDLDTGFNCYQDELCCDYMAGVCAGLNNIDVAELEKTLIEQPLSSEHSYGSFRVEAIENGIYFAKDYMLTHNQVPTFYDCLKGFRDGQFDEIAELARLKNDLYIEECAMDHYKRLIDNEPENEMAKENWAKCIDNHEHLLNEYSSKISFMGIHSNIDTIYDPHIENAIDSFNKDIKRIANGDIELEDAKRVLERDKYDIDYWDKAKSDAKLESDKTNIFLDGINAKLEIAEKYRIEKRF